MSETQSWAGFQMVATKHMRDGEIVLVGSQVVVGVRPLTDVERTIQRIVVDVFGQDFLKRIRYPISDGVPLIDKLHARAVARMTNVRGVVL